MTHEVRLGVEEFAWLVDQAWKIAPPDTRLEAALQALADLTRGRTNGAVQISWSPGTSSAGTSVDDRLSEFDGPMAKDPEAQVEQILALATWLNLGQRDLALQWLDLPLAGLGGKSPRQLIGEGHAEGIRDYIISICSGPVG